jgi:hypothetical protein
MFKPTLIFTLAVSTATLVGCSFAAEGELPGPSTLWEELGTRETLALEEQSDVDVKARDRSGADLPCVQPEVIGGRIVLRSTESGLLLVEALDVDLTDVTIEPGVVHSEEIQLTDLRLRLGTQLVLTPEWGEDGRDAYGEGTADMLLDWAVVSTTGEVYPLATQRIRDAGFTVAVRLEDDGSITADMASWVPGPVWDFSAVEITDFNMAVSARTGH